MAEEVTPPVDALEDDIEDLPLVETPQQQQDTPAPTTPPAEDTEETGAEGKPGEAEPAKPADAESTEATAEDSKEETPQEQPQQTDDQRKEAARQAYMERQRTRQHVEKQINEVYAPKSEEQLVEEGLAPEDARIQALREELNFRDERMRIAELNSSMQADAVNVMADFPVFNEKSPDFDKEFTDQVFQAYQTAARVQADDNGIIHNAEVPLYDFYKQMNAIYTRGSSKGSEQGQADAIQMLARTEDVGASSSARTKGPETLDELEERLGDTPII